MPFGECVENSNNSAPSRHFSTLLRAELHTLRAPISRCTDPSLPYKDCRWTRGKDRLVSLVLVRCPGPTSRRGFPVRGRLTKEAQMVGNHVRNISKMVSRQRQEENGAKGVERVPAQTIVGCPLLANCFPQTMVIASWGGDLIKR